MSPPEPATWPGLAQRQPRLAELLRLLWRQADDPQLWAGLELMGQAIIDMEQKAIDSRLEDAVADVQWAINELHAVALKLRS